MAKVEIQVCGYDVQDVEFWKKKLLKQNPELSPATDASKHGNRYRVTLSEETELERKKK